MDATANARREMTVLLLSLLAAPAFFGAMAVLHATTCWDARTGVLLGTCFLACGGVSLLIVGLCRRRRAIVVSGMAVLLGMLVGLLLSPEARWVGMHETQLVVRVVDAQTGNPVPDAAVRLVAEDSPGASVGRTDADGVVGLNHFFCSYGASSPYCKTGKLRLYGQTLQVEAQGYQSLQVPLEDYTGRYRDLYGPPLPPVTVSLTRK
jgi:hypothetical protein